MVPQANAVASISLAAKLTPLWGGVIPTAITVTTFQSTNVSRGVAPRIHRTAHLQLCNSAIDNSFCFLLTSLEQRRCHDLSELVLTLVSFDQIHQMVNSVVNVFEQNALHF